ncbi:MAG: TonB-dependent receptor, partial [Acidobacteriaceae bacterium]|nr:TonB-dependent receptor [Acidobacteriaceae bacterium]
WQPPTAKTIEGIQVSGYFSPTQTDPAQFIRNQYNASDDFSLVKGKHSFAFGGSAIRAQVLLRNQFRTSGSFSFTSDVTNDALASFMQGYARTFTQGFGEFKDNLIYTFNLYAQDDYHVSRRLTINLGLRYDPLFPWMERKLRVEEFTPANYYAGIHSQVYVNAPAGLLFPGDPGVPKWGANGSYNNVAPRAGFAYDLTGDGRTSLRGGAGVYYDALLAGAYNNRFVDVTPFSPQFSVTTPPGTFSNPYVGYTNPFPAPFPPPKNISFQPYPVLAITYDTSNNHKLQTPTVYNWNLSFERQLTGSWLLRLVYAGSRSNHLLEAMEMNPAVYIPGSTLGTDARRTFQPYGSILQSTQDINSIFHSAQVTLQKRLSHGMSVLANYTWSKAMDDTPPGSGIVSAGQGGQSAIPWNFPGRHQFDYGPADFDHTQRLVVSYVWDLPKLADKPAFVRYTLGAWQWTGIVTAMSGGPFTVLAGVDRSLTGLGSDHAVFTGIDPYGGNACGNSKPCVNYLNPAAFALPAIGTFGNVGKGSLRGPNLVTLDAGLFKEFPFAKERARFQFRAEFFNVFNRVNFNNPTNSTTPTFSAGGFGTLTSSQDPRIGQLALKLLF